MARKELFSSVMLYRLGMGMAADAWACFDDEKVVMSECMW